MPSVVITGASQGIGRAVAEVFAAEHNARIALLARTESKLQDVAARCEKEGAEALVHPCDVTDEEAVARVAEAVMETWGTPDIVVNNAGLFLPAAIEDISIDDFRAQLEVNLTSAFIVTKAFLDAMLAARRGHLFFMASVASITSYPGGAAYAAAKHGMLGLARTLREETREHGLRVTTLIPGATYTPSWEAADLPEERFMRPRDVAHVVRDAYQLSDRSVVEEIVLRPQLGDI